MERVGPGQPLVSLNRRRFFQGVVGGALMLAASRPRSVPVHAAAPAAVLARGSTANAVVALTFDCGSDLGYTGSILDTASAYGVPITFGVTGAFADAHPATVRRMVNEGHAIMNHSYSHPSFTGFSTPNAVLTSEARLDQLARTETAIVNASGRAGRPLFRPPYGDYDNSVLIDLGNAGFSQCIMWTIDVLGWNGYTRDQVISRALNNHGNGYIYLMHVGSESQEGPALPTIIEGLRNRGYGFVSIPQMLNNQVPPSGSGLPPGSTLRVTDGLYLRTGASLNSGVITTMPNGTVVTVVSGPNPSGGYTWYQVDTPYGRGWAAVEFMAVISTPPPEDLVDQIVAILIQILNDILSS